MKKVSFGAALIALLCFYFFSCAQYKSVIKDVQAYYWPKQYGTIRVDEKGNPLPVKQDSIFLVYVVTASNNITWDTAWMNSKCYRIVAQLLVDKSYEAGQDKASGQKVVINATEDQFIYQLNLEPVTAESSSNNMPAESNKILLKASYKGKTILKQTEVLKEIELPPPA